jgi:hypothetical protein
MKAGLNNHLVLGPSIWECTHPGALPYTKLKDLLKGMETLDLSMFGPYGMGLVNLDHHFILEELEPLLVCHCIHWPVSAALE